MDGTRERESEKEMDWVDTVKKRKEVGWGMEWNK